MPKQSKIKWTKQDADRISKLVRKFNAKITRVSKKNPSIVEIQPKRANSQELQKQLKEYPRKIFNREVAKMERYLRQGYELPYTTKSGVNTTIWEKKEVDNTFRAINAQRRSQLKKMAPSPYKGNLYAIETENLTPRKNTVQSIKPKNWDKFVKNLEAQSVAKYDESRMQKYKENYLKAISEVYSENSSLYEYVKNLNPEKIIESIGNPLMDITFIYDLTELGLKERTIIDQFEKIK